MINPTSRVHPFSNAATNLPQLPFTPLKTPIFKPFPFIPYGNRFTGRSLLTPLKYGPLVNYRQQNTKPAGFFSDILYSYIEPGKIPRQVAFKIRASLAVLDLLHTKYKD